jgi:hypothetical protein
MWNPWETSGTRGQARGGRAKKMSLPGFDVVCVHFEAYPEVHLRSSLWPSHDVIASRRFRNVHHGFAVLALSQWRRMAAPAPISQ